MALITIGANTLGLAICARGGMSPGEVVLLLIVQLALWLLGLAGWWSSVKNKLQVTLAQLRDAGAVVGCGGRYRTAAYRP